jgi:glycerol-3-phosphate acyltransferase PlsY
MNAGLALAATLLLGYGSGSLPFGLWLGRWLRGVDVRTMGSGNLGATNVYRSLGPGIGVATLLLDIAKGAVPVWLLPHSAIGAAFPGGPEWCALAAAFAAVAGHVWTFLAAFKGGKGVATSAGVLLALSPASFGVFVAVFLVARFSPSGVASPSFAVGALLATLVIVRHKDNIARLLRGEERRFSFTREKKA